jgi:hypothetical protein
MRIFTFVPVLFLGFTLCPSAEVLAQDLDSAWVNYAALPEVQKASKPGPTAYRIQLFSGSRTNALALRNQARALVPDSNATMQFDAPYFKVYAGVYTYRMQAERHLPAWRLLFSGAFVVETPIRRSSIPKERLRSNPK